MDHSNFKNYKAPAKKQVSRHTTPTPPEQLEPPVKRPEPQPTPVVTPDLRRPNSPKRTKHTKAFVIVGALLVCLLVVGYIGLSTFRGMAGKGVSNNSVTVQQLPAKPQSKLETAGFTVYGINSGSLYSLSAKNSFDSVPNSNVLVSIASSTVTGDASQLSVSQQPIGPNFESDPDGLTKLLGATGTTTEMNAETGRAFLVKGSESAIIVKPGTLITLRATKPLGSAQWQSLINNLTPLN